MLTCDHSAQSWKRTIGPPKIMFSRGGIAYKQARALPFMYRGAVRSAFHPSTQSLSPRTASLGVEVLAARQADLALLACCAPDLPTAGRLEGLKLNHKSGIAIVRYMFIGLTLIKEGFMV